jgi:hypothetical protein
MFVATGFNQQDIVKDGLVLWLDANDKTSYPGTGTTWTDLSRTAGSGSLVNGPTYNSANGGSIVFDGVDDYVDCGNGPSFQIVGSITTETWVNLSSLTNSLDLNLLSKYSNAGSNNQGWILFKSTGNYEGFGPGGTGGPSANEFAWLATSNGNFNGALIGSGEQVLTNTWYQVVGVFNSSNNNMQIYINSVLKRSATRTGQTSGVLLNASRNICVGATPDDNTRYVQGKIPITRIYNRALSSTEVLQNYNAQKGRFGL